MNKIGDIFNNQKDEKLHLQTSKIFMIIFKK